MNLHSSGKEEFEHFIKPIAIFSRLISLWPLERDHSKFKYHLRIFHIIGMIIVTASMTCAIIIDVVRQRGNIADATECALLASGSTLCFVRVVNYSIHGKDIRYVVETMRNDWIESTPEDRIVLKKKCHFTFALAKQFIVTVVFSVILFMLAPMIDIVILHSEKRVLPFRGYYIKNQTLSPTYECLYVCTMITGGLCASTTASATSFNLVSTMHGAARFAILQRRLESLKSDDPDIDAAMIDCVKRHQDAIKFANALERIVSVLALAQFVISTGLVCCAGFQITSMVQDKGRLMKYCSCLNSAILELFLFSYSGNQLIIESEAVRDSAYAADWFTGSFTQNLKILMLRTTLPSKITAAKFYDMSLQSFASVLRTSFSYFTLLQTINEQ